MPNISVRPATIDDAAHIADIHVRAWRATYRNILPDKVLGELSVDSRTLSWTKQISGDAVTVLIAEDEDRPCGWIAYGRSRDKDIPFAAEVYAFYLEPDLVRQGIGRKLWGDALQQLRLEYHEPLSVWVITENTSARRFYEAMGGWIDAKKIIKLFGVELEEVRYRCPVRTSAS